MPILFVHGVNTRNADPGYFRNMAARKKMFEEIVVPVAHSRYPEFSVADDAYWGDLGVQFRWGLSSIPKSDLQSLGVAATRTATNTDLLTLLLSKDAAVAANDVQSLGAKDSQAVAALVVKAPANLVRAVYAPQVLGYEPEVPTTGPPLTENAQRKAKDEGEHLAWMLLAADQLAADAEKDPSILQPPPGRSVLDQIQAKTHERFRKLSAPEPSEAGDIQTLGWRLSDGFKWAAEQIKNMADSAKALVTKVQDTTVRGASLLALQTGREDVSRKGLRFLGDVFVYLHRGRSVPPTISSRVVDAVRAAAAQKPLVVVSHSFGSEIMYDALTAGKLNDVTVDLWVTAGAQTSLFAEMALFEKSDNSVAPGIAAPLGKPANVRHWINFYDAADILSYLHEPIFGSDAVTDISVREGANLGTAHGHYFLTVSFYRRIAQELAQVIQI